MKNIVKKNQVIITAFAILIAVVGYLNYTEKNALDQTAGEKSTEQVLDNVSQTGDNVAANLNGVSEDALKEFESDDLLTSNDDIESNDSELEGNENATQAEPGEAVLTSATTFSANAKLSREQVRAQNKETLLNTLNSGNLSEEQKQQLTDEMIHITEIAQMENDTETLLNAKGFTDAIVSISDKQVDVVLNMTDVSDAQRAQIEDVVKRKTAVSAENIIITPVSGGN